MHGFVFVVLAIIGFGEEHDKAFNAYKRVESKNSHVKVLPLAAGNKTQKTRILIKRETNPETISKALLDMIEQPTM